VFLPLSSRSRHIRSVHLLCPSPVFSIDIPRTR
jgi:hypothetical protein